MMNGTPTIRLRYLLHWFCQILVGSENCSSGLKTVHSMLTSRWAGIYFQLELCTGLLNREPAAIWGLAYKKFIKKL